MNGYNKEQLKQLAIDTVAIEGSKEYLSKIMQLSIKMGLNPSETERRIRILAQSDT
jgi:hypothetical protein